MDGKLILGGNMTNKDKLRTIEALAKYLADTLCDGQTDEYFFGIYTAQTTNKDDDYISVAKQLFEWADEDLLAI